MVRDNLLGSIGRVVGLWRYPVKSMTGEALEEIDISWHGLAGDRRWAFVRGGVERSGFPWLTIRERRDMVHYRPHLVEPDNPDKSAVQVLTPTGQEYDIADMALAAELGPGVRVIKQDRGVFDTFPLSLITTQAVGGLGVSVNAELDVQRFRPNLLIEATTLEAFPEDAWVGRVIRIGEAMMRVDKRDKRCAVVNVDPATGSHEPSTLRAVAGTRDGCLGVYGSTVRPGRVAIGDEVYTEKLTQ
ncbi:MAG: MOSC N-terminal beta barrel domain-containing protein [Dokdonella sp.]